MRPWSHDGRLIAAASVSETFALLGTMLFPSLLPSFQAEWRLTNTDAGWINGIFYAGHALAAPFLIGLTDREDPRRVYLASAALGAAAMFGFAFLAHGFWTAMLFQTLAGVSFAGVYMPGLKAMTDRLERGEQSRAIAIYTACTGTGLAMSVWLAGFVSGVADWRWAAIAAGLGAIVAFAVFALALKPKEPEGTGGTMRALLDFRPVLGNRQALGYVIGYAVHNWELFGFRGWVVAYLAFVFAVDPATRPGLTPQELATVSMIVGIAASFTGNELAGRFGRRRMIAFYMISSGLIGVALGLAVDWLAIAVAALVVLYGWTTMQDSASLTAGMVAAATPGRRGLTMAAYSFVGFVMAFLSPLAFGIVLDLFDGGRAGWIAAFMMLAAGALSGPLWMRLLQGKWERRAL